MSAGLRPVMHMGRTGLAIVRGARQSDSDTLAQLANLAGDGLPYYLWSTMAGTGVDPWEIGRTRAARETGSFSYRNSIVLETNGEIAGALVGYPLAAEPRPTDSGGTPAMLAPLLALEHVAAGSWYVNAVATFPEARGLGVGSELLRAAEQTALQLGHQGISLVVSDANRAARKLYLRRGFKDAARRPMIKGEWKNDGENWILMIKELGVAQTGSRNR